ncbi:MAG: DUF1501 domain-containing protein [Bacteroidetes Order II. Incertae sedis bacterium]|nr:DUF1501 domain-containing protein [Bacteroidetes Order II. bacterium]
MCQSSSKDQNTSHDDLGRFGDSLSHGDAHAQDHARWTRRDFLYRVGAASLGASLMMSGLPVRAYGGSRLLERLSLLNTDKILVIIQLNGGNDGLNTIIPVTNDRYYSNRPNIGIKAADAIKLSDEYYIHKSLSSLQHAWGNDEMAILHSVGYPTPNLSHFRATDIWVSGSGSGDYWEDGWIGRSLDTEYPEYKNNPTPYPLAVQIGSVASMLFRGPDTAMGLSVSDPSEFYRIVSGGAVYDPDDVPTSHYGTELSYVRSVANDSVVYGTALKTSYDKTKATVTYPSTTFAGSLAIVSRLIRGELGARIYHVSLSGFDTHASQATTQANLLLQLGDAVKAFTDELNAAGYGDRVLSMTFSEFGRRVKENGSSGTDHGTAAPMFLFGKGVNGGFFGTGPDLVNLDAGGNIKYSTDFRAVYGTVLLNWFGMSQNEVQQILGLPSFSVGGYLPPIVATPSYQEEPLPHGIVLEQNFPNPFKDLTTIRFTLPQPMKASLRVYDLNGRMIAKLTDSFHDAGNHDIRFNGDWLPNGRYLVRLETPVGATTRQMTINH